MLTRRLPPLLVVSILATSAPATAQTDSRAPNVRWWKEAYVVPTDNSRGEIRGRLLTIEPDVISIDTGLGLQSFALKDIARVQVRGDGIGDGAGRGMGIAFSLLCITLCSHGLFSHSEGFGFVMGSLLYGGLIGAGVDSMHSGRTTIYPMLREHASGTPPVESLNDAIIRFADSQATARGKLLDLNGQSATLLVDSDRLTFDLSQVDRVSLKGDSVWNGGVIGAIVGVVQSGIIARSVIRSQVDSKYKTSGKTLALTGAQITGYYFLIGVGIDAIHQGSTPIYDRPRQETTINSSLPSALGFRVRF